jgi:DNA-directed RNA polymerase omega subunit
MMTTNQKTSIYGNLKQMLDNSGGSKFMLVNIVRKRAAQLNNGAPPLTDRVNPNKPVSTAFNEISAGMIPYVSNNS